MKYIFDNRIVMMLPLMLLIFSECSVQSRLNRNYKGKDEAFLLSQMGQPIRTEITPEGNLILFYEMKTLLSPAKINTGQYQYDQFESPSATKTEYYTFFLDTHRKIYHVEYNYRYER